MKRAASRAEAAASTARWRRAMQRRASRISAVVRSIPSIVLAEEFTVSKDAGTWTVTSCGETVLVITTRTSARTIEEVVAPIPVQVVDAGLVDHDLLLKMFAFEYISFVQS